MEYCYGIKKLKHTFDFSENNVVAIYASNGTMKTSFAKCFEDIGSGHPKDRIDEDKKTICDIKNQDNDQLKSENILVIQSRPIERKIERLGLLLMKNEQQEKYSRITQERHRCEYDLIKHLVEKSGISKNSIEQEIRKTYKDMFEMLEQTEHSDTFDKVGKIKYSDIFNDKTEIILNNSDFKQYIEDYVTEYEKLLGESKYLGTRFDLHNVENVKTRLGTEHFFHAGHSLNLKSKLPTGDLQHINMAGLENIINEEREKIESNPKLTKIFTKMEKKLNKNKECRIFYSCILENKSILHELKNKEAFAKKIWKTYLSQKNETSKQLLRVYKDINELVENVRKDIKNNATVWNEIVKQFHNRFDVPFEINIGSMIQPILDGEDPKYEFRFQNSHTDADVSYEQLDEILSEGEHKARFILNILFEIHVRISEKRETLVILDDIVDSFDYKNKYAFLQYIRDISEKSNNNTNLFKIIILTHTFDFFRAIQIRNITNRKNCYGVEKTDEQITLEHIPVNHLRNINLEKNADYVATIPFIREILYHIDPNSCDYKRLTAVLHWRTETKEVLLKHLVEILQNRLKGSKTNIPDDDNRQVFEIIFEEADKCIQSMSSEPNLTSKLILSIAIRLRVERYISKKIGRTFSLNGEIKNTYHLIEEYRRKGLSEHLDTLNNANFITADTIHLNSFMYGSILDMSDKHLKDLYNKIKEIEK